jgi:hypothetical protein
MATKKQMQELQNEIKQLKEDAEVRDKAVGFLVDKARNELLDIHNSINCMLSNMDECEGDFWFSDLQRLRKTRDNIRKSASIEPPRDEEGNRMWHCHEWVLEDV